jgi:hypothetical protein
MKDILGLLLICSIALMSCIFQAIQYRTNLSTGVVPQILIDDNTGRMHLAYLFAGFAVIGIIWCLIALSIYIIRQKSEVNSTQTSNRFDLAHRNSLSITSRSSDEDKKTGASK